MMVNTLNLHWYKSEQPIEPYVFRDIDKGLVGYKEKQAYPDHQYLGDGKYEDVKNRKISYKQKHSRF